MACAVLTDADKTRKIEPIRRQKSLEELEAMERDTMEHFYRQWKVAQDNVERIKHMRSAA